jgi:UDP:flavonoid glycosyltransferase YjiC (YdhE family)
LNGFSELIVPRPRDWNEKQVITGYWRKRESTSQRVSDSGIQRFVDSADNLIAIGFGSPGTRGYLPILEEALNMANAQAVLTLPEKYHGEVKSKSIFPIEFIPHDWLYPRVKVAIHHGGAGTTSASLHAGIPTIALPLAIDQFFWGERIQNIGAGLSIPQRKLTAHNLAQAITEALNNKEMNAKAKAIGDALNKEDGVQVAIKHLTTNH